MILGGRAKFGDYQIWYGDDRLNSRASTLGTPIIIGLSGFNTAYVIEGALLVALAAIIADRLLKGWCRRLASTQIKV